MRPEFHIRGDCLCKTPHAKLRSHFSLEPCSRLFVQRYLCDFEIERVSFNGIDPMNVMHSGDGVFYLICTIPIFCRN